MIVILLSDSTFFLNFFAYLTSSAHTDVIISLNGRDVLEGVELSSKDAGIVAGDLVFILAPAINVNPVADDSATAKPQPQVSSPYFDFQLYSF